MKIMIIGASKGLGLEFTQGLDGAGDAFTGVLHMRSSDLVCVTEARAHDRAQR